MRTWSRHSRRALPTQRSANAFAFGARIGVLTTSRPSVRKTSSKVPQNFESRSRSRICLSSRRSAIDRFRACWVTHTESGRLVYAGVVDSSRGDLDEEQDVQRLQQHGLYREEVVRQHSPALCPQELAPCRTGAAWCRPQAGAAQDPPDGTRPGADPELAELALDPDATPPGILPAETRDEIDRLAVKRRPTRSSPTVSPLAPDELAMPPKERPRRDHEPRPIGPATAPGSPRRGAPGRGRSALDAGPCGGAPSPGGGGRRSRAGAARRSLCR